MTERTDTWHTETPANPPILDIGGDVGAALVTFRRRPGCTELTACPRGHPERHFHTGVHQRRFGGVTLWVALFPQVPAGEYSLLAPAGEERTPFSVRGGSVTTVESEAWG